MLFLSIFKITYFAVNHLKKSSEVMKEDSFVLYVKQTGKERLLTLTVKSDESVLNVKQKIEETEDIPSEQMSVSFIGQTLENRQTLKECQIKNGCLVILELYYKIHIKSVDGQTLMLFVDKKSKTENLRELLRETGIAGDRLIYAGKPLKDGECLEDNIKHGSILWFL